MIENVKNENIVKEIKALMDGVDSFQDEVNVYCDLMKQMFLQTSNVN